MPECLTHQRRAWRGWLIWGGYALVLLGSPWVFDSSLEQSIQAQIGIAIIACLSFNLLWGQGGMLSFGHAVYTGLGSFLAIYLLNAIGAGWAFPVSLVPLAAGLGAAVLALALGWVCTRRPGTAFAMLTFGLGELVWGVAQVASGVFGGEAGISGNRAVGSLPLGFDLGPTDHYLKLLAIYVLASTGLMYGFTRTPLGRLLNAVRDNASRVAFVGHDPHRVRWLAFVVSAFFAGIAGGLAALHFELVTADVFSAQRSGSYLLFTVLGGSGHFAGPVLGAVLLVLAQVVLSSWSPAWLLYMGAAFVAVVLAAPGGLADLFRRGWQALQPSGPSWRWRRALPLGLGWVLVVTGAVGLVELSYHWQQRVVLGPVLHVAWATLNVNQPAHWWSMVMLLLGGGVLLWLRPPLGQSGPWQASSPDAGWSATTATPANADPTLPGLPLAPSPAAWPTPASGCAPKSCAGPDAVPVLELVDVGKCYGTSWVLRHVSLRIEPGERVGIIGPNGAGKSTLLDLISARQCLSSGQIWFHGARVDGQSSVQLQRLGLARSFQTSRLFGHLTVQDNLRCALLWTMGYRYDAWHALGSLADVQERVNAMLAMLQLIGQRDCLARELAYADQRALELGLALSSGAHTLLLDEPTAGMSRAQASHFVGLIERSTVGRTLLIVEHDMHVLFGLASKIAVFSGGELLAFDRAQAVRADARVQQVYGAGLGGPGLAA